VKSLIDPGLEGDLYSDQPHLYGNALSSFNVVRVGEKVEGVKLESEGGEAGGVLQEGGDGDGVAWRKERDVPEKEDARKKWALKGGGEKWEWEAGRVFRGDFFNPFIDFNGGFHRLTREVVKSWRFFSC